MNYWLFNEQKSPYLQLNSHIWKLSQCNWTLPDWIKKLEYKLEAVSITYNNS